MSNSSSLTILFVLAILLMAGMYFFFASRGSKPTWKSKVQAKLDSIKRRANTSNLATLQQLLIETDKLLDYALQQRKIKGGTLGERLKNAKDLFDHSSYNNVWEAHKLRNRLVHEVDATADAKQLKTAVTELGQGIMSLAS